MLCPPSSRSLHCLLVLHYLLYFTSTKLHAFFFLVQRVWSALACDALLGFDCSRWDNKKLLIYY